MCGRYAYSPSPRAIARFNDVLGRIAGAALQSAKARYNIAATATVPIVVRHPLIGYPEIGEARRVHPLLVKQRVQGGRWPPWFWVAVTPAVTGRPTFNQCVGPPLHCSLRLGF